MTALRGRLSSKIQFEIWMHLVGQTAGCLDRGRPAVLLHMLAPPSTNTLLLHTLYYCTIDYPQELWLIQTLPTPLGVLLGQQQRDPHPRQLHQQSRLLLVSCQSVVQLDRPFARPRCAVVELHLYSAIPTHHLGTTAPIEIHSASSLPLRTQYSTHLAHLTLHHLPPPASSLPHLQRAICTANAAKVRARRGPRLPVDGCTIVDGEHDVANHLQQAERRCRLLRRRQHRPILPEPAGCWQT